MPLDPERVKEVREWFRKASEDLRAAIVDLAAQPPLTGDAAFHSQQAAEKAIKGFLSWHDQPFGKTHNLVVLGEACSAIDGTLDAILREAAVLTEFVWRFRYPGEDEPPTREGAMKSLDLARRLYDAILQRLPPEVKPG